MMKDKLVLRRLALLLCLSLIVGIIPITALSVPVTLNVPASATELVVNGDFQTDLSSWGGIHSNSGDNVVVVDGAAQFTATSKALSLQQTIDIPDAVNEVFKLKADFTRISGTGKAYLMLKFKDAANAAVSLTYKSIDLTETGEYALELTAPAGTVVASVEVGNHSSTNAVYTIDNVSLTKVVQEPDPTDATDGTESTDPTTIFTDFVDGSAIPDASAEQWKESNGGEETVLTKESNMYKVGRGGNNKLVFQGAVTNVQYYAKSPVIAVTGGATYTANYEAMWHFSNAVNGVFEMSFVDAEGNALDSETGDAFDATAAEATWTGVSHSAVAPAAAVGMFIKFSYCRTGSAFDYWVRNLSVTEVAAEGDPTESTGSTEATSATESTEAGGLINGDFENGTAGWPSSSVLTSWTDDKHGGDASMKFTDSNGTSAGPYFQQVVSVEAGKTYKLSAWVKVLEGSHGYIGVYGIGSASAQKTMGQPGDWKQIEVTVTIPEGKTEANVQIGANSGSDTVFLIDDMVFTELVSTQPDPTESTAASDPTESTAASDPTESTAASEPGYVFQDFMDGSAIPDISVEQWKEYNGDEETVLTKESGNYKVGRGVNNKLVFQSPTKGVQYYAKSPVFAVTGGMTYTVDFQSCWYFSTSSESSVELVFVDAQGNVLATESGNAYNKNVSESVWGDMSLAAVAPEAAAGAYLKFNFLTNSTTNYWVRNLTVSESETIVIPTQPSDPNLMLEDKFEVLANADDANSGPVGWISSDDAGSVYSIAISCAQRNSIKHDGNYLLLQMVGNWTIQSPEFAVKPGYEYTADFLARKLADNTNFNGYLTICFVDMFDLPLKADKVTVGKTYGQWAAESVKAIAPAGAVKAYLIFGLDNDNRRTEADYAIDDLKVTQSTEPAVVLDEVQVVPTRPVFEDSFDNYFIPEGSASSVRIPNGWTASAHSAAMTVSRYADYDGTNNLCLQDLGDKWIRTPLIDVTAGYTYTAIFMEKKLNPASPGSGGYAKIVFTDGSGNVLGEVSKAIGNAANWTRNGVQALAPAGAVKCYVEIGLLNAKGSNVTFCVEDLQVIEAEGALVASGGTDYNPATRDDFAPVFVSTLMIATLACAVVLFKKRRSF